MGGILHRIETGGGATALHDYVDALRFEHRGANLPPFVDATKRRPAFNLRKFEPGAQGVDRTAEEA